MQNILYKRFDLIGQYRSSIAPWHYMIQGSSMSSYKGILQFDLNGSHEPMMLFKPFDETAMEKKKLRACLDGEKFWVNFCSTFCCYLIKSI
jgi:hypothetical protein